MTGRTKDKRSDGSHHWVTDDLGRPVSLSDVAERDAREIREEMEDRFANTMNKLTDMLD